MNLKLIEARIAKLERDPRNDRLNRLSDEELEAMSRQLLDGLIADHGSFAAVVAEMRATDDPEIREGARLMVEHHGARYGYTAPPDARQ